MHQELSNTYGRKTIANELDNKPIRDFTLTEKDIRPMFVQVQILERGQYFVSKMLFRSLIPDNEMRILTCMYTRQNGLFCGIVFDCHLLGVSFQIVKTIPVGLTMRV